VRNILATIDEESGFVYEGTWNIARNCPHGDYGLCLKPDGSMYEGQWRNGREHGKGMLMSGEREIIYDGDWAEGNLQVILF